jgi:hypothetical protein
MSHANKQHDRFHNKNFNVPEDFDWMAYRSLNKDLQFITNYKDAVKHYKAHGFRQNRPYTYGPDVGDALIAVPIDSMGDVNRDIASEYQNKLHGVPANFNWIAYKSLNKDLNYLRTYLDAVKHYRTHGFYQNRQYCFGQQSEFPKPTIVHVENEVTATQLVEMTKVNYIHLNRQNGLPEDFDWNVYKSSNPDLQGIKTYSDAAKHYKEHGYREHRKYKTDSDQEAVESVDTSVIIAPMKEKPHVSQPIIDYAPPLVDNEPQAIDVLQLPKDFDWVAYKTLNPDLQHLKTRQDAINHYIHHGWKEARKYRMDTVVKSFDFTRMTRVVSDYDWVDYRPISAANNATKQEPIEVEVPMDFDWRAYKMHNPDLTFINSYSDAIKHYQSHGYKENRQYVLQKMPQNPQPSTKAIDGLPEGFNWLYYRVANSDLKEITTEQEAIKHYLEHGYKENRKYKPDHQQTQATCVPRTQSVIRTHHPPIKTVDEQSSVPKVEKVVKSHRVVQPKITQPVQKVPLKLKKRIIRPVKTHITREPIIISTPEPSPGKIPNILHFIYGFKEQTQPFDLVKYISILSAYYLNRPEKVYFYYKFEPFGPLWEKIKPYLTLVPTDPPEVIFGNKVTRYAHKADIVRLQILNQMGGIYLDIDTICVRSLTPLLEYDFVMGIQGENYGLCNAIMMAKPNTEFGKNWMKSYESFNGQWDLHSVKIPYNLSKIYPITILPNDAFFYPLWDPFPDLVLTNTINYDCCRKIFQNAYCLHLWDTWCGPDLRKINEQSIHEYNSLYNIMGRKFVSNCVTILMIVQEVDDQIVQAIGTFYKVLARDEVNGFVIYNDSHNEKISDYLANLPNINPKFTIIHDDTPKSIPQIKADLISRVKSGIIWFINGLISLTSDKIVDESISYMYDESIGMIGVNGGYVNTSNRAEQYQNIVAVEDNSLVDYINTLQIFRSELLFYNVKVDTDQPLYDIDFSFQVRNMGKSLLVIASKDVQIISNSKMSTSKEQWSDLFKKWSNLVSVRS